MLVMWVGCCLVFTVLRYLKKEEFRYELTNLQGGTIEKVHKLKEL